MAPKKLSVHTAVRQDCARIISLRSWRVAAMTIETAAKIGNSHNRYTIDIATRFCSLLDGHLRIRIPQCFG